MRSVSVRLADLNKMTIPIGFVGENLHTQVRIDCVKLFEDYPNAVPELTVNPPMGDTYPAVVTRDGDYVIWEVEDSDLTVNGNGEIQLSFFADEVIAKSYISRIRIDKSLIPTGDVPTPIENWIDEANEKLAEVEKWNDVTAEATTLEPRESATAEITEENGHNKFVFGIPEGEKGEPGDPGFSPTIVVTDITGGHRVSITDVGGTQTIDIMDGEKGDTGNGIASAVLNQDYTLTLNFTDGTHYTTPSIRGAKGETGNGIASVTLNQDYTLTITYTNGQSTTTTSIRGEKGDPGATPVISIGTVTTLSPGSDATATMDTTDPEHPVLSLGIPEGEPGEVTEAELSAVADSKADVITDTASGAIASLPDGANGMPVKSLVVNVDPVQDLHGYDSPWPAGGSPQRWDEEWEGGSINPSTGANANDNTRIRSKNYIPVLPSTVYYCKSSKDLALRYYGSDKSFIGTGAARNSTVTTPENCYYMRFAVVDTTSYGNDISINYPATETAYYSYSNICPISGWDSANVSRTGKNLLKIDATSDTKNYVEFTVNADGSVTANGTASGTAQLLLKKFYRIKNVSSYKFTGISNGSSSTYRIAFVFYDKNNAYINENALYSGDNTITFPQNAEYADIYFRVSNGATVNNVTVYPMIRFEDIADATYEPFGNVYSITFPEAAKPVYGGTLTVNKDGTGELVVEKSYLNAKNAEWSDAGNGRVYTALPLSPTELTTILCSHCEYHRRPATGAYTDWVDWGGYPNSNRNLIVTMVGITDTLNAWNAYIQSNDVEFVYYLETPVTYQLTNQQVIETLKGINNVLADTGNVSAEYPCDTKLYISRQLSASQRLMELIITANHEDSMKATKAYTSGNLLIVNGTLYKATTSIANGATLTVGTNISATTVANELALLA